MNYKWSILVCSYKGNEFILANLLDTLRSQIDKAGYDDIEVLVVYDYGEMEIGEKRNLLMGLANGEYISFIDDDDTPDEKYIEFIYPQLNKAGAPDLLTFGIQVQDENPPHETFKSIFQDWDNLSGDGYFTEEGDWRGIPSHFHVWKRKFVERVRFPSTSWREDLDWMRRAKYAVNVTEDISDILLYYNFDSTKQHEPKNGE